MDVVQTRRGRLDHPHCSGVFTLRAVDLDRDLATLHTWMNDPVVAQYWLMAWSIERIAGYLRDQQASAHSWPFVGELDGIPVSYWELYRADLDQLAQHYPARDHDVGFHMLVGPAAYRGHGLAGALMRTVAGWQLDAEPRATRVVTEPDARNRRVIRMLEVAGFHRAATLDLPTKQAALMVRDRDDSPGKTDSNLC